MNPNHRLAPDLVERIGQRAFSRSTDAESLITSIRPHATFGPHDRTPCLNAFCIDGLASVLSDSLVPVEGLCFGADFYSGLDIARVIEESLA